MEDETDVRREVLILARDMRQMNLYVRELPSSDPHYKMFQTLTHVTTQMLRLIEALAPTTGASHDQ